MWTANSRLLEAVEDLLYRAVEKDEDHERQFDSVVAACKRIRDIAQHRAPRRIDVAPPSEAEAKLFEIALTRPKDYHRLSEERRLEIDKELGVTEWKGGCAHESRWLCEDCNLRWLVRFCSRESK